MDKYESFVSEYVVFILQLPPVNGLLPPAKTITFNTWEVWEVDYDKGTNIEFWTSETGVSNSVVKRNGQSFSFKIEANDSPKVRQQIFDLFDHVSKGCDINFTFTRFQSYIPTFPQTSQPSVSDIQTITTNLPYACISMLSKPIDSTYNGYGIKFGENSVIGFTVKEAVSPFELTPCKKLSMQDYSLSQWIISNVGHLEVVFISANISGLIDSFLNHPSGTLTNLVNNGQQSIDFSNINANGNGMQYTDQLVLSLQNNTLYQLVIPNIKVLLKTGETCELTFIQQYFVTF